MNIKNKCLNCNDLVKQNRYKFCSKKCIQDFKYKERITKYLNGELKGWCAKSVVLTSWLRKYIKDLKGTECSKCKWNEYHPVDDKSLTEINHIDGNAKNCQLSNLEILCPNCHSKTYNFRARNKKSFRVRK